MTFEEITKDLENKDALPTLQRWLDRGDGIALYDNQAMDSGNLGHKKWVSYGSKAAQLEVDEPPQTMPNIGSSINWSYQLIGTHRR